MFAFVCDGEAEGDELDEGGDVEAITEDGLGDWVEAGIGIGAFGFGTASAFGAVKKGTNVTVPKVKSSLKS